MWGRKVSKEYVGRTMWQGACSKEHGCIHKMRVLHHPKQDLYYIIQAITTHNHTVHLAPLRHPPTICPPPTSHLFVCVEQVLCPCITMHHLLCLHVSNWAILTFSTRWPAMHAVHTIDPLCEEDAALCCCVLSFMLMR